MQTRHGFLFALSLVLGWCVAGCGAAAPAQPVNGQPSRAPSAAEQQPAMPATASEAKSDSNMPAGAPDAAPVTPAATRAGATESSAPARSDVLTKDDAKTKRPGLATQFGEDLQRGVSHTRFYRASASEPFATSTIWYNDAAGAAAMAQSAKQRSGDRAEVELFHGGLVVSLVNAQNQPLPGFIADDRPLAIGEPNARYAIHIVNKSDYAFEVVASVDGLSVIDGRPASFERRGYLMPAHEDLMIEGYRTSEQTIAAFRFGKVEQSYSVATGQGDRNVGVIGVAFFHEKGKRPEYRSDDTVLRQNANPFPGTYSPRPPER
jgi:hypothetical protein